MAAQVNKTLVLREQEVTEGMNKGHGKGKPEAKIMKDIEEKRQRWDD